MNKNITKREENFAQWYQDVIAAADLAEHSGVKGSMIIKPYGFALWERLKDELDQRIKATGHKNAYFPLLIPESYLKKEKDHVEGFSPELAVVTHAGGQKLDEPLVVRPTSETIIYDTYSRWIQSYRDLPLLINQWANVVRWELRPRLFLRTTEFLWQEGHTAHATEDDAQQEVLKMLGVYKEVAEEVLAMPVFDGEKSESERFAGAKRTYTIEAMMQDSKALQAGTSHNLGQGFSKAFNVEFTDADGGRKYAWLTSWGVSTRMIGGLIMTHSDDLGLMLPPKIAPVQVVIVPIYKEDSEKSAVMGAIDELTRNLPVRYEIDDRDFHSPGYKFNEWEKKGVPIRIEVGPRDVQNQQIVVVRRDTSEKEQVKLSVAVTKLTQLLDEIQESMATRALGFRDTHTFEVSDFEDFKEKIEQGFVRTYWCEEEECEVEVKSKTKATVRCLPFETRLTAEGKCIYCSKEGKEALFAKAY